MISNLSLLKIPMILLIGISSLITTLFIPHSVVSQTTNITGTVYLDANENGLLDKDEKGIVGVKVSNGLDVVKTDENGKYSIAIDPENTIFISKPANYRIPLNDVQLPQFYYHFYPDGTPGLAKWKWPVIKPTGKIPDHLDFALLPTITQDSFKAMGFADPQTATHEQLDMMRKDIIDELLGNSYDAKFGLVAGDVVNDNLALYERHNMLMAQIGIPMWNVPGNHDLNKESPNYEYSTQTYQSVFGPDYYSFDYGEVHFLALNNVGYKGKGKGYQGHIDVDQMKWIENDLADVSPNKLIVIITHIPLITYANNRTFSPSINTVNFDELLKILERFTYIYTISGHDTSNSWKVEVDHKHGWYGKPFIAHTLAEARGGGWETGPRDTRGVRQATMEDGNPNGYYVLHFEGNTAKPEFIPAGRQSKDRLSITLDPPLSLTNQSLKSSLIALDRGILGDSTFIVVNFFDGGVRDSVKVSIDGEEAKTMEYTERIDPFHKRQYERYKDTPDAFRPPAISSHIWQILLPKLNVGLHSAIVKVKDEFGFEYRKVFTFEVMDSSE